MRITVIALFWVQSRTSGVTAAEQINISAVSIIKLQGAKAKSTRALVSESLVAPSAGPDRSKQKRGRREAACSDVGPFAAARVPRKPQATGLEAQISAF
jgi:hypothetical protein